MDASSHFLILARYNVWATHRLLATLAQVSDADYRRECGLFFKSIHGTLNHLLVAEHLLWRQGFDLGLSPRVALDAEVEVDRAVLAQLLQDGADAWLVLITAWPAARFEGRLDYTNMRGHALSLPFAATLAHVFNHGTHHRGQITAALTAQGQPCPELDRVYMLQHEKN